MTSDVTSDDTVNFCHNQCFSHGTVPTVIVERPNVTVPENEAEVEICLILSTGIVEQVVVTAETGPKTGATDQATGSYNIRSSDQ